MKRSMGLAAWACLPLLISVSFFGCVDDPLDDKDGILEKYGQVRYETGEEIKLSMCRVDDCKGMLIDFIEDAEGSLYCALFDLDEEDVIKSLAGRTAEIDVRIVVDDENIQELGNYGSRLSVRKDTSSQYSHNKFCVADNRSVLTGSANPTRNGLFLNDNNMIVVGSKTLATNYASEFFELWEGEFGDGEPVREDTVFYNGAKIENFFCPEDDCRGRVAGVISGAKKSVHFMTFSFTDEAIADAMLYLEDVEIKGVFERVQAGSGYSQFKRLEDFGIDVAKDGNPKSMHHKAFIIDSSVVALGSYNPTASGADRNDENVLVVYDEDIAGRFEEEFFRVWNESDLHTG